MTKAISQVVRSSNIELMRCVLMLMIVFSHSPFALDDSQLSDFINYTKVQFGQIGNAGFFIISGYFFINHKKLNLKKILFPLYFYFGIYLIINLIVSPTFLYETILNLPLQNSLTFLYGNYWFIPTYILINVLANIFREQITQASINQKLLMCLVSFSIFAIYVFSGFHNLYNLSIINIVPDMFGWIPFFIFGIIIKEGFSQFRLPKLLTIIIMVVVFVGIYAVSVKYIFVGQSFSQFFAIPLFLLFQQLNITSKKVNLMGGATLDIYFLHSYVASILYFISGGLIEQLFSQSYSTIISLIFSVLYAIVLFSITALLAIARRKIIKF
jgi:hypothetical protein